MVGESYQCHRKLFDQTLYQQEHDEWGEYEEKKVPFILYRLIVDLGCG